MSQIEVSDPQVRTAVYDFFISEGRAPVASELAAILGTVPIVVEEAFGRLHDAHQLVLAPGTPYIWMANPFSALPTPYRVTVGERGFWGNCIWDSLGIVAMFGGTGTVSTRCPDCGESLSVDIADSELLTPGHLVHFAVPAAHWWDDIGFN